MVSVSPTAGTVCYRHPDRSTYLRCSNCDRPICIECTNEAPVGQKCPECAAPAAAARQVTTRQARRDAAPATIAFMAISVILFLAPMLLPGVDVDVLRARFGQFNLAVAAGEWWRIFSAAFLHVGMFHLLFNMWALWIFGRPLESQTGSASFASLYLASAVAGGAAAFLLSDPRVTVVGASGAIFGLFGAWLYSSYRSRHTRLGNAQFRNLLVLLGLNVFLSLSVPAISWQGHAGGLLAGFVIAALWSRSPDRPAVRVMEATAVGAVALALVLLA